jgi:hypothetical protein
MHRMAEHREENKTKFDREKKNEEKKQYNTGVISWFFLSLFALHGVSLITTQSHV